MAAGCAGETQGPDESGAERCLGPVSLATVCSGKEESRAIVGLAVMKSPNLSLTRSSRAHLDQLPSKSEAQLLPWLSPVSSVPCGMVCCVSWFISFPWSSSFSNFCRKDRWEASVLRTSVSEHAFIPPSELIDNLADVLISYLLVCNKLSQVDQLTGASSSVCQKSGRGLKSVRTWRLEYEMCVLNAGWPREFTHV